MQLPAMCHQSSAALRPKQKMNVVIKTLNSKFTCLAVPQELPAAMTFCSRWNCPRCGLKHRAWVIYPLPLVECGVVLEAGFELIYLHIEEGIVYANKYLTTAKWSMT